MTKNNEKKSEQFKKFDLLTQEEKEQILQNVEICPIEVENAIKQLYNDNPELQNLTNDGDKGKGWLYRNNEPWIQTYTGRRFNPTNPVPSSITIEDIAHALSMQCRFSGHINSFYSVAQHSVLVSYICDSSDALAGLLHDASEAYLVDIPRPIKKSGKFDNYLDFEIKMEKAIADRFNVPDKMPPSVKMADDLLLSTEARDLLTPKRDDWQLLMEPLPFKIIPWSQQEAKNLFIKRYCQLTGSREEDLISKPQVYKI